MPDTDVPCKTFTVSKFAIGGSPGKIKFELSWESRVGLIEEKCKTPSTISALSAGGLIVDPINKGRVIIKNKNVPNNFMIPILLIKE